MEGWLDEMVRKTLIREAYSGKHLPRDPAKVDSAYRQMMMMQARYAEIEAEAEIEAKANAIPIDTQEPLAIDTTSGEVTMPAAADF